MSSLQFLRDFVTKRLSAAAEEIFRVFEKTIVQYEEELNRQRRRLDAVFKPEIKLHRIELQQQRDCKEKEEEEEEEEEEVLPDLQLRNQERNFSLDQEDPESLDIKEVKEEIGEVVLKQETETFTLTPKDEEPGHGEPEPGPGIDQQVLCDLTWPAAEDRDHEGIKHADSGSNRNPGPKRSSETSPGSSGSKFDSLRCHTCGKEFEYKCRLTKHLRVHTGETPYSCPTCGKSLRSKTGFLIHLRTHTGERPYACRTCGRSFYDKSGMRRHLRRHTGKRPYACRTCGKRFCLSSDLKKHARVHSG